MSCSNRSSKSSFDAFLKGAEENIATGRAALEAWRSAAQGREERRQQQEQEQARLRAELAATNRQLELAEQDIKTLKESLLLTSIAYLRVWSILVRGNMLAPLTTTVNSHRSSHLLWSAKSSTQPSHQRP
jgi:hypothetical protein